MFSSLFPFITTTTKDDATNQPSKGKAMDAEEPFYIVVVDIKVASLERRVECVKLPLVPDKDLNYVALSYRWGELSETIIDTEMGYLANITSFNVYDFFNLCWLMSKEQDLCDIKYVWVDAICVNQTDDEQRKATVHQMSTIYERANYIVAVPDLHSDYLAKTTILRELTDYSEKMTKYIYHLLHGHAATLLQLDTDSLAHRLGGHDDGGHDTRSAYSDVFDEDDDEQQQQQPAANVPTPIDVDAETRAWNDAIAERNTRLPPSMALFADLIRDWSSRVWVISEYHIAKGRHDKKMKYWFLQLLCFDYFAKGVTFFEFDFFANTLTPPTLQFDIQPLAAAINESPAFTRSLEVYSDAYQNFHTTMIQQLVQQNLFEMLLKSKASKNQDRFYAVLPISKYKHQLTSKDIIDSWNIHTTLAVRLKLFEWMDTTDKLALLYLSYKLKPLEFTQALPTFATAEIDWDNNQALYQTFLEEQDNHVTKGWNFDPTISKSTVMLIPQDNDGRLDKLHLKPKEYHLYTHDDIRDLLERMDWQKTTPAKRLGLDDDPMATLDIVAIPFYVDAVLKRKTNIREYVDNLTSETRLLPITTLGILLLGSFAKNRWTFAPKYIIFDAISLNWEPRRCSDEANTGFYIY